MAVILVLPNSRYEVSGSVRLNDVGISAEDDTHTQFNYYCNQKKFEVDGKVKVHVLTE